MSDAFIIGQSWISEHFFANDGTASFHAEVLKLVKDWRDTESSGHATARSRFREARLELISLMGQATDVTDETAQNGANNTQTTEHFAATRRLNERLFDVLGFNRPHLTRDKNGPLTRISTPGLTDAPPLAVISARPVADVTELLAKDQHTLAQPYIAYEDADPIQSVARLLSDLFTQTSSPHFALVLAGNLALIAEQERWMEGRYLAVDIQQVAEANDVRRGGEIDRAIACLGVDSLAPDAEGTIWWQSILETSVSHTVGVSEELRTGVRESIEILASEVVRRRAEQGLDPLPTDQAQPLASQSLRFLYRILFLLYAEASPELGVLPVGDPAYEAGYSLDRLRELALVKIEDQRSLNGTHLYESLATLFRLVDQGHAPNTATEPTGSDDLTFHSLRADLFEAAATAYIDEVKLGNEALQEVLRRLLVKSGSRSDASGFISYADLGINQLGAVYEGLMSYTGFFAQQDLYEVAPGGDSSKGSWVVPVDRAHGIAEKDFVRREDPTTGESKAVLHARGSFVFRLSGRERQQSASYYSPEVITKFTVGQALEELLDQGETTSAQEILDLKICEPALGSGAFAIEAVRQLADQYLRRREAELGIRVEPDERPRELQKIKAYIALHNVYGVDLNGTAIELAEISLWLDTMHRGLDAPWFGLHLRRGNSLIGARRATFRSDQVLNKTWLKEVPRDVPLTDHRETGIHHFLLPSEGWGAAIGAKEGRNLAPDAVKALRDWRRSVQRKPTKKHVNRLEKVAARIETLWDLALRRLRIAEAQARRSIDVWGAEGLPAGGAVSREEIEEYLASEWGSFQRLKIIMDAWCALWFWPLTERLTTRQIIKDGAASVEHITPPSFDEWLGALEALVGTHQEGKKYAQPGGQTLSQSQEWDDLNMAERLDMQFSGALNLKQVRAQYSWLEVCEAIADEHGFFHWELFFGPVFADRGGFDLQVGNPPWVRPDEDTDALLAEGDPWWQLVSKAPVSKRKIRRENTLELPGIRDLVIDGSVDVAATRRAVSDPQHYPHLVGLRPDLYRCFMEQTWRNSNDNGITSLVHPESHFVDEKAQTLRRATYRRLRRHWQFINELRLYEEIDHHVKYGVHVYGSEQEISFLQASSLYHPDTVQRSIDHNGDGGEPGLKDENTSTWDLRPHRNRILRVDQTVLSAWHSLLEAESTPAGKTRMVYTVNHAAERVLEKIARAPRIGELSPKFSQGWNETTDFNNGRFSKTWGPLEKWSDAILQGPHLHVATPFFKSPNSTMRNNLDWSDVDLEALQPDALPVTSYKPAGDREVYDANYTHWDINGESVPARDHYRIAWRNMAANTGERTLISAIIPPGVAHIHGVSSGTILNPINLIIFGATLNSLVTDFTVRVAPKSTISPSTVSRLASPMRGKLIRKISLRALRLNAVADTYSDLWRESWEELAPDDPSEPHPFNLDAWIGGIDYPGRPALGGVGPEWTPDTPLRRETDRRQALVEIDVLVALTLSITADELCTIYRTQFPVLYGYDHGKYVYDANGRLVPTSIQSVWRKKGDDLSLEERTATHPDSGIDYVYELPFTRLDREADFRRAYVHFEKLVD